MNLIKDGRESHINLQKSISKGRLSGDLSMLAWVEADFSRQGLGLKSRKSSVKHPISQDSA